MLVGYARVSTPDQSVEAQVEALKAAGCERVFSEVASGAKRGRPVLTEALDFLHPDDTLVVFKLDRVARSLPHLIELMESLKTKGTGFRSLTEEINTTAPGGKLLFHLMAAIAEFERDLIRERTMVGLNAARAKGRTGGRPRRMTDDKIEAVRTLLSNGAAVKDAAAAVGVSVPTLYRYLPGSAR